MTGVGGVGGGAPHEQQAHNATAAPAEVSATMTGIRDGERIIAEFAKNSRETLRVVTGEYRGHQLAHIRSWVPGPDGVTLIPTKAGISIRVDLLPQLIAALQRIATGTAP
jgi:hypothetical protein